MSNISYRPRPSRLAHGARTAADLAQYSQAESLRAAVKFERPAFNRSAWEAVAVGVVFGAVYYVASVALFGAV